MADPIKTYGPYNSRDAAARAGFKQVMLNNQWLVLEYGFWVVFKVNSDKSVTYYYTEPQGGEGSQVKLTAPPGLLVRAFCHTHPQRLNSGDFGPDDKLHFQESRKVLPGIVWYLLNPFKEIRLAVDESQFPAGAVLK
jgi:hypothetical protein